MDLAEHAGGVKRSSLAIFQAFLKFMSKARAYQKTAYDGDLLYG
jgi:hypothetical protein